MNQIKVSVNNKAQYFNHTNLFFLTQFFLAKIVDKVGWPSDDGGIMTLLEPVIATVFQPRKVLAGSREHTIVHRTWNIFRYTWQQNLVQVGVFKNLRRKENVFSIGKKWRKLLFGIKYLTAWHVATGNSC